MHTNNDILDFLKKWTFSLGFINNDDIKKHIDKVKKWWDFLISHNESDEIISTLWYTLQEKNDCLFIDSLLIEDWYKKKFKVMKNILLDIKNILDENKLGNIQFETNLKNKDLIKMYAKKSSWYLIEDNTIKFIVTKDDFYKKLKIK